MLIDPFKIAWCAGLFEGEGSIFLAKQKRRGEIYIYERASLKMTDLDIIERFHLFVECGTVTHQTDKCRESQPSHYKKHYYWQLSKRDDLVYLMMIFWPWLGLRRRNKVLELGLLDLIK